MLRVRVAAAPARRLGRRGSGWSLFVVIGRHRRPEPAARRLAMLARIGGLVGAMNAIARPVPIVRLVRHGARRAPRAASRVRRGRQPDRGRPAPLSTPPPRPMTTAAAADDRRRRRGRCLFAALFARLWYLQVIDDAGRPVAAQGNGVRIVYEPAPRGRILDRKAGSSSTTASRAWSPSTAHSAGRAPTCVAALAAAARHDRRRAAPTTRRPALQPVPRRCPSRQDVRRRQDRVHPASTRTCSPASSADRRGRCGRTRTARLAANLLGYVGRDQRQRAGRPQEARVPPGRPDRPAGVEPPTRRGSAAQPGVTKLQVDSQGRVLGVLEHQPPVQGHDLQLTHRHRRAEAGRGLAGPGPGRGPADLDKFGNKLRASRPRPDRGDRARPEGRLGAGPGVVPTYDPAEFVNGISPANFAALLNDPQRLPARRPDHPGPVRPGIDVQAGHRRWPACRPASSTPSQPSTTRASMHDRATTVLQRQPPGVRLREPQPGHHRVERRVLLQRGRPVLERPGQAAATTACRRSPASSASDAKTGIGLPNEAVRAHPRRRLPEASCTTRTRRRSPTAAGSRATTSTPPSARAMWPSPRCSWPTPTPPSPTAAPCGSR